MCGVLTQIVDIVGSKNSELHKIATRETLEFAFESDVIMSGPYGNSKVSNFGTGINGRLLSAVAKHNVRAVKKYLKYGADPNVIMPDKRSALHLAAASGHVDVIELLLNAGADPSPLDQHKRSPLHLACMSPHLSSILTLLYGGANPNAGNQYQSALHLAILGGDLTAVTTLIDSGADVNVMGFIDFNSIPVSPLGLALQQQEWRRLLPVLLNAGAHMNNVLGSCMTASTFEVVFYMQRDLDLVRYLIQNGCVPTVQELEKKPFLTFRCRTFRRSLVALLLRLVQDRAEDVATVRILCQMLEAAGYELQKDPFCKILMGLVTGTTSGPDTAPIRPRLTPIDLQRALQLFHWGGLSGLPTEEMVDYVDELLKIFTKPKEVPSLASLCRSRVRARFAQVYKVHALHTLVERLPLPNLHKKFLLIEEFH